MIAVVSALLFAATAQNPRAPTPELDGRYVVVSTSRVTVDAAIEAAISRMSFFIRPIARRRLESATHISRAIQVTHREGWITVQYDGPTFRSRVNGPVEAAVNHVGEPVKVLHREARGGLEQTITAEDGSRVNLLVPSADGKGLVVHVEIRSSQLPAPVVYEVVYAKKEG